MPKTKAVKKEEVHKRQEAYSKLTTLQKLQKIEDKYGSFSGANKQRNKLRTKLSQEVKETRKEPDRD